MRKTCLIPSDARFATPPAGSSFGIFAAFTSRVPAETCAGDGDGMRSSVPWYWRELKLPFLSAVLPVPFRFSTRSEPSEATATALGNHAVGIAPATFHSLPDSRSTAIALLPPHPTYSVAPSLENASAIGWLPRAASG